MTPLGSSACFHAAHHLDLDRLFVMRELTNFEPADAVLGADRAVEANRDVMERCG